jgi:hypothetical protein
MVILLNQGMTFLPKSACLPACLLVSIPALGLALFFGTEVRLHAADDALAWPAITSQTRPWAWWWWHGSAVDETNLALQLQQFHDAGLGGVQITSIYGVKGQETHEIPYLCPAWLHLMGYTVDHARQLDMGVDMSLGSGWCFGGPTVSSQDANASAVVKTYDVPAGGSVREKFKPGSQQALVAYSADGKAVELTDKINGDGSVEWTAPTGTWTVYAVSQKPSGQKVKRPAIGGEGWMLNPLCPEAVTHWLTWFDHAFTGYEGSKPQAVFQDSYEYRTDWSPDFFAQFEQRRGYRLQDELPALFGQVEDDHAARVKYDYRRTVSEIMAEQSEPAWIDWAHQHGFSSIYQAHGTPGNWLDLYGDADIPETEMFHNDRSILISKFASSAAHTQGHPLTGAETGTWLKEHFTETLADLKYLADDMFLAGVNHIYYHGACYSPANAPWPGWVFYASTEMNPRNSIWHDVGALNDYIARCQSVLQAGKSDNDILLYWPVADFWSNPAGLIQPMSVSATDWFENQPIGKTAHELWNEGYAFDYVSDAQLLQAKVVGQKIELPGGDYKIIIVPRCQFMPLATFKQLLALANQGATVVFDNALPDDVAGWNHYEQDRLELQALSAKVKPAMSFMQISSAGGEGTKMANVGRGNVSWGDLKYLLGPAQLAHEPMASAGLSFIRRSFDGGRYYFIVNRNGQPVDRWLALDRPIQSAVLLDPMTGRSAVAQCQAGHDLSEVYLKLAPGESVILRTFNHQRVQGPTWANWETNGQPGEITGNWNVNFIQGGPILPASFLTSKLGSWTDNGDTNTQSFAGTADYTITFDAPAAGATTYSLDLGDVRQSARVTVNGKDYGTLITPPFRILVDNLKPTGNELKVEVTNVSANRIRDLDRRGVNWKIFKDINVVNESYHPLDAANWPLTASGLLGPVTLTPMIAD